MRKIKFRGKTPEGKWIYGGISINYDRAWIDQEYYGDTFVDKETIGQYTGIKDKNGVEIYEGDILAPLIIDDYDNTESMVITYSKGAFGYYCKKYDWFETLHDSYVEGLEVIGNIYDNPELLKESD